MFVSSSSVLMLALSSEEPRGAANTAVDSRFHLALFMHESDLIVVAGHVYSLQTSQYTDRRAIFIPPLISPVSLHS